MCCGGEMAVFLEVLEPVPRLFVFGAGYIARPLATLAAGCGFEVTVVDESRRVGAAGALPGLPGGAPGAGGLPARRSPPRRSTTRWW